MMPLHTPVTIEELEDTERFDFLQSVKDKIVKVDELHSTARNDTEYVFVIWLNVDDSDAGIQDVIRTILLTELEDWRITVRQIGSQIIAVRLYL